MNPPATFTDLVTEYLERIAAAVGVDSSPCREIAERGVRGWRWVVDEPGSEEFVLDWQAIGDQVLDTELTDMEIAGRFAVALEDVVSGLAAVGVIRCSCCGWWGADTVCVICCPQADY